MARSKIPRTDTRPALTPTRPRLAALLRLLAGLGLALALGAAALSAVGLGEARRGLERMALSQAVHAAHLSLVARLERLLRARAVPRTAGAAVVAAGEAAPGADAAAGIERDLAAIRAGIAAEIERVGDTEVAELDRLAGLERRLDALLRAPPPEGGADAALVGEIDGLIAAALAEEASEIAASRAALDAALARHQAGAGLFAVAAALGAALALGLLARRVGRPLGRLAAGARLMAGGALEHRLSAGGVAETLDLERSVNRLAERARTTAEALERRNAQLERSISDRTRQFENALEDARRAEARRRRMLADVSHELRTPLTIIRGEADVALRGGPKTDDEYRDALLRARDAAEHTARIVDDLLFIARTEGGEARLRLREVELRGLLDGALETFRPGLGVTSHILRAPILADADRLRQAVLILLQNARQYGGTEIVVRLDPTPEGYRIAVEDDGPGMSDEDKAMAFQRYFRGANASETHVEGLGLGLPVALSIAEAHGGTVTLADREGGGLVAAITVPLKPLRETVRPAA